MSSVYIQGERAYIRENAVYTLHFVLLAQESFVSIQYFHFHPIRARARNFEWGKIRSGKNTTTNIFVVFISTKPYPTLQM